MIILNPLPEPKTTLRRTLAQNSGVGPPLSGPLSLANLKYELVLDSPAVASDIALALHSPSHHFYYREVPTDLEDRACCFYHSGSTCHSWSLMTCERYRFDALTYSKLMGKVAKREMIKALYGG